MSLPTSLSTSLSVYLSLSIVSIYLQGDDLMRERERRKERERLMEVKVYIGDSNRQSQPSRANLECYPYQSSRPILPSQRESEGYD